MNKGFTMKKSITLAALAVALMSSGAYAADVYSKGGSLKDDGAPGVRVHNWSGVYAGVGCGVSTTTIGAEDSKGGISADGQLCDARLGVDVQRGAIVFGAFASYALSNEALEFGSTTILEKDHQWDVNGRLGLALGNVLLYGHGGYGEAEWGSPAFGGSADVSFWQAGVGIEYAIVPNFSIGLEYAHAWLNLDDVYSGLDDYLDGSADKVSLRANYRPFGNRLPLE
jgi:outer membrane immunogenic protein